LSPPQKAVAQTLAAEQQLLAFLLHEAAPREMVRNIIQRLQPYRFRSIEHHVLFECIRRLSTLSPAELLAELPAALVRAGFPDFDLERFLREGSIDQDQAAALCGRLAAAAP
jgi:hypothetical protein